MLYLRNLPATSPDGVFYPDWDDELRQGFRRETELFFESIMREDRNVVDLLTADYTFVNERLARHYGIPNIYGSHFRRVTLGPELDYRRGLLGKGSFLSITWTQNFRTSPVKRGVWVLENILGTPPPEPPPNVPPLEDSAGGSAKVLTLREQMTLHRENPSRARAATRSWTRSVSRSKTSMRTESGEPSRAATAARRSMQPSSCMTASTVDGPVGLRQALLRYSPQFVRMLTEKMMTYALGRGRRVLRYARDPLDRAGCGQGQQPVLGDRDGNRQERAVPDANEDGRECGIVPITVACNTHDSN